MHAKTELMKLQIGHTKESREGRLFFLLEMAINESATLTKEQRDSIVIMVDTAITLRSIDAVLEVPVIATYINSCHQSSP